MTATVENTYQRVKKIFDVCLLSDVHCVHNDGMAEVVPVRAHEAVIDYIRDLIETGDLAPGDRLPAERDLADEVGISRPMVREGLRTLETLGVISARRGQGPDAGTTIVTGPTPALATLLDLEFVLARFSLEDVIETRLMLEQWSIRGMPADCDLTDAAIALQHMSQPLTREELLDWDLRFHTAIVEGAGNRLITHMYRSLRKAMEVRLIDSVADLSNEQWVPFWRRISREHRLIYATLDIGDREEAAALAEAHITRHYLRRH